MKLACFSTPAFALALFVSATFSNAVMFDVNSTNSYAMPGRVPAPVDVKQSILETKDWKTEPSPDNRPGEYFLRFNTPVSNATVIAYDSGTASYLAGGKWLELDASQNSDLKLRVLPLPANVGVDAIRFVVPAKLKTNRDGGTSYETQLSPLSLMPFRGINIAADASVVASSADKPSQGFRPQPWLNKPETLVDGFVDARRNFFSAPRETEITPDKPETVLLAWDTAREISAIAVLRGQDEKGLGENAVEVYTGKGDPRFSLNPKDWAPIPGIWSSEGSLRSIQWFCFGPTVKSNGLRLKTIGGVRQISLGEIVVLQNLGMMPTPKVKSSTQTGVPISFSIPSRGKVTLQIRNANDEVVANPVAGVEFEAGEHTAYWNLDDLDGNPVLDPGTYLWRGLYVPGLKVEYQHTYYPTPLAHVAWQTPDKAGGWLADHEPPRTICRGIDGTLWLGAFAEAGDSIVQVNAKAEKIWGIDRIWVAIPQEICTDGDFYYGFCEGAWIKDAQAIIQVNQKTKASRKIFQRTIPKTNTNGSTVLSGPTGFQVVGNRAFVSFGASDEIQVFDIAKGLAGPWRGFGWDVAYKQFDDQQPVLLKEIFIPSPGRLRRYGDDKLVTTTGKDIVTIDLETYRVDRLVAGKLHNPLGLGVDTKNKNIYVGEGEPLHQVFGFDAKGNLVATLGKLGRRKIGPFDFDDLEAPFGVEVAEDGRVWVMEHTDYVKRVSLWNPETAHCVKDVVGPTPYGGGGSIDPENENRLFHKGIEFSRNPTTGDVKIVNLIYRPDTPEFAKFSGSDYPSYAFRTGNKNDAVGSRLWFTSHMQPHGHPSLVLWEYKGDHVQPVAAVGTAIALRRAYEEAPPKKGDKADRDDTSFLLKHFPDYDTESKFFTWTDLNDDGNLQTNEVAFGKLEYDGKLLTEASAAWNWRMNDHFIAAANAGNNRIVFFTPKGFSEQGYPIYDVPRNTVAGNGQALMPDSKGNAIVLGGPMTSLTPEGEIRWKYRNEWPGLHAGHLTTALGDEPGVLIAPTRIWGIVPVNDDIGEVVAFNSNLGCTYLMTAEDGLFIDRVFRDQRVGLLWNTVAPPSPDVLAETSLYDEHFGGTLQKIHCTDGIDRYYYVCGKNHCSVVELSGLNDIRRLRGSTLNVTPQQISDAQAERQRLAARSVEPKILTVSKVATGDITIDGNAKEWPKERTEGFALAYDDERLYVLFQGQDDRATFENKGANPMELFKTGDVVDVMLQTDSSAAPTRMSAESGDMRLSFSIYEGKPVCVRYDFVVPGYKGERVPFSSPWRTTWCDRVGFIDAAKIQIQRRNGYFTLEASVPLTDIRLSPKKLGSTRGDVGRVMSDDSGTRATRRVYWANKNTAILSDLPSEAALQPDLWGLFRFSE